MNETEPNTSSKSKKNEFNSLVSLYLESKPHLNQSREGTSEFEIRFGTNKRLNRPITKNNYDNVIKQLYQCGFRTGNTKGLQMLRVQNEYINKNTGRTMMSNIRTEIVGMDLIQKYCETNDIDKLLHLPSSTFDKIKFTQKTPARHNDEFVKKVDMDEFNFRGSFQVEKDFHSNSHVARSIIGSWKDDKKIFRLINRVRFEHPTYPIFADVSIVKSSRSNKGIPIKQYTIQDAGVLDNVEHYEIELEIDNSRVGTGTPYDNVDALLRDLRKCIRFVLSGLQQTKYPISYDECQTILNEYVTILYGSVPERRITPKDFTGPSSYTLQMENVVPINENSTAPNIRSDYTVTDKADGDRMLCFVNSKGKIYFIDTTMNIIFTGTQTLNEKLYNTIIDGEYIKKDKNKKDINVYAAFDIYYINKKSIREFPFMKKNKLSEEHARYPLLNEVVDKLDAISILDKSHEQEVKPKYKTMTPNIRFQVKEFYQTTEYESIFECCFQVLTRQYDNNYEYETDGLIFTPSYLPVNGDGKTVPTKVNKQTWKYSLKWKPPEFNTIDFLVSTLKDEHGQDKVSNIFEDGTNLQQTGQLTQFKTLVLRCGYDKELHGYINPCAQILQDQTTLKDDIDNNKSYKPVPFQPTNPPDPNAHLCNIKLTTQNGTPVLTTEEGEYFEENTIVEFKYVHTNEPQWKWVPIRVRHDKTTELKNGQSNYGNAYHVANSNWYTIHNPITENMLMTGTNIPEYIEDSDVYYRDTKTETSTRALRDFHNKYVKKYLIKGVSNANDTLIDYAVGKGGDLSKWIDSKLEFVYGIDVSRDNIHNSFDGVCARYLGMKEKNVRLPTGVFVHGNSAESIRNGTAFHSERDKQITNAVFGKGSKDKEKLSPVVYKSYGIGENGFNISSCQFAIHYFFESKAQFHGFMRNISECTKLDGYFIATTYDGNKVFDMLKNTTKDDSISFMKKGKKIYEIKKLYDKTGFPNDEESIGYGIEIYQESINKPFPEYLVNYEFFVRAMENYGFVLIDDEEASHMNMPGASNSFSHLYDQMKQELQQFPERKRNYKEALYMSEEEKQISFLNRYYIFKKVRNVDMENVEKVSSVASIAPPVKEKPEPVLKKVSKKKRNIAITK
jgi:hypothetical protein